MKFEIIGDIKGAETIAIRHSIRELARLRRMYGEGRWRKLKGRTLVKLSDGSVVRAELHWYEAHSIGKKEIRVKWIQED